MKGFRPALTGSLFFLGFFSFLSQSRCCAEAAPSFTEVVTILPALYRSDISWGDYDGDGLLDIALAGSDSSERRSKIYHNDGDGVFTELAAAITQVYASAIEWGDYDNDGDLDFAMMGSAESNRVTEIYKNEGGVFTNIDAGLVGGFEGSLTWGDYDNDGDLDLAVYGKRSSSFECRVYRNDSDGSFVDIGGSFGQPWARSVLWGDLDNDGDLAAR